MAAITWAGEAPAAPSNSPLAFAWERASSMAEGLPQEPSHSPLDVFSSRNIEIDVSAMQQIKQNTHIIYLTPKLDFGIP